AQAIGKAGTDANQPRPNRVSRHVEYAAGVDMVEALGIDQQQGEALLRRQVAQEAGREVIEGPAVLVAEELREAGIVGLGLAHRIGMAAQLGEPELIDLGEGPAIERGPALIAVLLGKHELQ